MGGILVDDMCLGKTLQERKRELVDSLIQPGESFICKMTEAEIRGLFGEQGGDVAE